MFKLISTILFISLLSACNNNKQEISQSPLCKEDIVIFSINNKLLKTEISCSIEKRALGLMNRDELEQNSGMLFLFSNSDIHPFWMKNTKIPLSIAYIDENWKIVDIKDMKPFDETPVFSNQPSLYALETNKNWFEINNIKIGEQIKILSQ